MHTVGEERFRAAVAGPTGTVVALPAQRQLGPRRRLVRLHRRPVHHGRRAAAAGVAVRALPRLPAGPRHGGAAADRRAAAAVRGARRAARGRRDAVPDGRPRPVGARASTCELFGATARMPAGPASLALATGSVLIPVSLSFTERGWRCVFHPEVPHTDVPTMTQALADAFAIGIAEHPQDWHMLQRLWLEDLDAGRPAAGARREDRPGLPLHLGRARRRAGARARPGRAPAARSGTRCRCSRRSTSPRRPTCRRTSCRPAARCPCPYNGSVARLAFGPLSLARTRRWLRAGRFDVLHLHEPTVPSVSMLALWSARGPMVATFHTSTPRSRALQVFGTVLQPGMEKLTGRIAVSPGRPPGDHGAPRRGRGAGAQRRARRPLRRCHARCPGATRDVPTVVFLGRIDEARKGLAVLLEALPELVRRVPRGAAARRRPGRRRGGARAGARRAARPRRAARAGERARTRRGCTPAAPSTARPTRTASPSASSCSRRWRPARPSSPATSRRSAGCSRTAATACCSRCATPPPWPGRWPTCSATPTRRADWRERGRAAVTAYDWQVVARQVVDGVRDRGRRRAGRARPRGWRRDDDADPDDAEPDDADPGGLRRVLAQLTGRGSA